MPRAIAPIPFAGSYLTEFRHVCAFFNDDEEEYRVLLPFIRDGFVAGEKAVHVVHPDQHNEHRHRLTLAGIDVAEATRMGQFDLRSNHETYIVDGRFDKDRMLAAFEEMASSNREGGFPLSRIVCRMDWASADESRMKDVIEFESRVNSVWRQHDDAVICTYQLADFSADSVINIMRTHPMVIIGGRLHQNPFFTDSEEFLREFHPRESQHLH